MIDLRGFSVGFLFVRGWRMIGLSCLNRSMIEKWRSVCINWCLVFCFMNSVISIIVVSSVSVK